jgi:hypothetical protein
LLQVILLQPSLLIVLMPQPGHGLLAPCVRPQAEQARVGRTPVAARHVRVCMCC